MGCLQAGLVELVAPGIADRGRTRQERTAQRTYVKRGIVNRLIERIKRL